MLFVPEVWADIRKYYEGSYVKFLEYGDALFFIERVREDGLTGVDEKGDVFKLSLDVDAPYNLTYTLPHKGLFMMDDSAYMLHRIPAVQYSRGITTGNTAIVEVSTGKKRSITFATLKAFIQKQPYNSLNEALFGKSSDVSVCMSRRFSFYRPKQLVYLDTTPIAGFRRKDSTVVALGPAGRQFFPELKALMSSSFQKQPILFE